MAVSTTDAQKILEEYKFLLEKSHQLFAGLRDVPQFGKQWQPYFQRTFEVYSKLWKFQQVHRATLENKEYYGLKRSEIGEIASKIGQLYYHYYLRTSDIGYLHESFVFYDAIRTRGYFKDVFDTRSPMMMVKKLRYYARFIVVCLLLHRRALVKELAEELQKQVEEYVRGFRPADAQEWQMLLQEVIAFLQAEGAVTVTPQDKQFVLSNRMRSSVVGPSSSSSSPSTTTSTTPTATSATSSATPKSRLQEAILVGSFSHQVKFSELTLDMFRMMLALEKEPAIAPQPPSNSPGSTTATATTQPGPRRRLEGSAGPQSGVASVPTGAPSLTNPHKYLLYRPTLSQLMTFLATAVKELAGSENILLLYISANSGSSSGTTVPLDNPYHPTGGIALNPGNSALEDTPTAGGASRLAPYYLYPGDLIPFTRRRLFLIVDSPSAAAFQALPQYFSVGTASSASTFACLLAPQSHPGYLKDPTQMGGLLTFFLYAPLLAFCYVCSVSTLPRERFEQCQEFVAAALDDILTRLISAASAEGTAQSCYAVFAEEEFLGPYLARFLLFYATASLHREFAGRPEFVPYAHPPLPAAITGTDTANLSPLLRNVVVELAALLNVSEQFLEAASATAEGTASKEQTPAS